jgi:hypothetical protein
MTCDLSEFGMRVIIYDLKLKVLRNRPGGRSVSQTVLHFVGPRREA